MHNHHNTSTPASKKFSRILVSFSVYIRKRYFVYSVKAFKESSLSKSLAKASDSTKVAKSGDSTDGIPSEEAGAEAAATGLGASFFLEENMELML